MHYKVWGFGIVLGLKSLNQTPTWALFKSDVLRVTGAVQCQVGVMPHVGVLASGYCSGVKESRPHAYCAKKPELRAEKPLTF